MNALIHLALLGTVPVCLLLFAVLPARRAAIVALLGGWMFLPVASYTVPSLPDYTKNSAVALGVVLGAALFDHVRLLGFRPRWFDLPMVVWCLVPVASSVSNGIGGSTFSALYGGGSLAMEHIVAWGVPYFIGRLYITDLDAVRELAVALFIGGLIYMPFCLFEIRMSPQLHRLVYGSHAHSFLQTMRFGGFRPTVFAQHGLAVAMFMTIATMAGLVLWRSRAVTRMLNVPVELWLGALGVTAVLCKSTGALALLVLGLGAVLTAKWFNMRLAMVLLVALAPTYMVVRTMGLWSGEPIIGLVEQHISEERAGSFAGRLENEDLLTAKAMERPLLGWSGWNRFQARDEQTGRLLSTPDGMWVIAFGQTGLVGLVSLTTVLLLPVVMFVRRCPPRTWWTPRGAPLLVLTVTVLMFMLDCLPNAMINPLYVVAAGGLMATVAQVRVGQPRTAAAAHGRAPEWSGGQVAQAPGRVA